MKLLAIVMIVVMVQRFSELALARRNYVWAMRHGGREYGSGHYYLFIVLHAGWLVSLTLEYLLLSPTVPILWPLFLCLILIAQFLRYWTISSLGRCWNTRIIVFETMTKITSGPYRYFRHPNYLAVVIEIAAIPALLGAWYTALIFSLLNGALLLLVRIPAEERALRTHFPTQR